MVNEEKSQYYWINEERQKTLENWWKSLDTQKGDRANLRRSETPVQAAMNQCVHQLKNQLGLHWLPLEVIAAIAGLVSHVKRDQGNSNKPMGALFAQGEKPALSELRFKKILRADSLEELFRNLRRALPLLKNGVNINHLAESLIVWHKEQIGSSPKIGRYTFVYQWSEDYYSNLKAK